MSLPSITAYESLDALPDSARTLFVRSGNANLFTSFPWFSSFIQAALPSTATPLILVLNDEAGQARAILPCQRMAAEGDRGPGDPAVSSLTSYYSCDFQPVIAADADLRSTAFALGRGVADHFTHEPVVRFDSLDTTAPFLEPFLEGLGRPGRMTLRYAHFGRWREELGESGFADYLARRDGALRETIRRKTRQLDRAGAAASIVGLDGRLAADATLRAIRDYETVYAASWKEAEPFPHFQPTLMQALADAGWLRLALIRISERPIAAQLWVVVGRSATVLKLAHDSAYDRLSPGTVLTAFAIRRLIESDDIERLDFGRGDDPYKRAWTSQRIPHIGTLWTSIAQRPLLVARHLLGSIKRRTRGG